MIKLHIGTANLPNHTDENLLEFYKYCKNKEIYFHSATNYKNIKNYFSLLNSNTSKKTNLISKIFTSKNPFKNFNILRQLKNNLNFFNVNKINSIQVCNNLGHNKVNIFLIKKILKHLKDNKLIEKIFIDVFPDYEKNLSSTLNLDFFDGYVFEMNIFSRSITYNFLKEIFNQKNKEIFIYSPYNWITKDYKNFQNFEIINKILSDKKIDINLLNANFIMFLSKHIKTNVILGTKKKERFSSLLFMENHNHKNILNNDIFERLLSNQSVKNEY